MTGYFGGYSQYSQEFLDARGGGGAGHRRGCARASGRPLIAQTMYFAEPTSDAMREGGVPVSATIEAAAAALVAIADRPAPAGAPAMPAVADAAAGDRLLRRSRHARAGRASPSSTAVQRARPATRPQAAAGQLGFPVVVKALGMLHKSDAGGVAVGIGDAAELERVVADMEQRLAPDGALAGADGAAARRASS